MKKILILAGSALLLILILLIGSWMWLNGAVKKGMLSGLSTALQAKASFEDVHLDLLGGRIVAENGILQNLDPQAYWNDAQILHAEASFKMGDVFKKVTPLTIEVSQIKLRLGPQANQELSLSSDSEGASPSSDGKSAWPDIEVRKFALHHGSVVGDAQHPFQLTSGELVAEKDLGSSSWTGTVRCETLGAYSLKFGVATAHFSTSDTDVQLDTYALSLGEGTIKGTATLPRDISQTAQIHYEIDSVPSTQLIPPAWNVILGGTVYGKGDFKGPLASWNKGQAKGEISLHPSDIKALPFLDKLAAVPMMAGLGHVSLDTAKTGYEYNAGAVNLTNLRLEKVATIALTGDLHFTAEGQLDGTVKLGLPPFLVGAVPKLKEEVFSTDADNYSWADVKISGTPDHLVEDLTPRVTAALGDQAKSLMQDAVQGAGNLLKLLGK